MKILHGTWIPDRSSDFIQSGNFYIWVETTDTKQIAPTNPKSSKKQSALEPEQSSSKHPASLAEEELTIFLVKDLGIKDDLLQEPNTRYRDNTSREKIIFPKYFLLPTSDRKPLPSLELARYLEIELPESFDLQHWQIDCYQVTASVKISTYQYERAINIVKLLNDLHFIAINNLAEVQLGSDLLFWYHYTQAFKQIILKDQYIPAFKYRELAIQSTKAAKSSKTSTKTSAKAKKVAIATPQFEIYPAWEIVSEKYETDLQQYVEYMPLACVAGFSEPLDGEPQFCDRQDLLRHFSESVLHSILTHTPSTAQFDKQVSNSLLEQCLNFDENDVAKHIASTSQDLEQFQQWQGWRQKINRIQSDSQFYLCFQLQAPQKEEEPWQLQFQVSPKQDPSLKLPLADYWSLTAAKK